MGTKKNTRDIGLGIVKKRSKKGRMSKKEKVEERYELISLAALTTYRHPLETD